MRFHYFLILLLAGITSGCSFGSFPGGSSTGGGQQYPSGRRQQYPDDTYSSQGNQPGSGRAADPGVTVNSIRLTRDYTILNLTFTDKTQPRYDQNNRLISQNTIGFDNSGYLSAANGARTFAFVKADGIPVKRERIDPETGRKTLVGRNTFPGDQVTFTLYFERLDKGLENFDLFECTTDQYICWNIYNLTVDNPADPIVYAPTPVPVPTPTKSSPTKKPTKLPMPSGDSGGETRTPEPAPGPQTPPAPPQTRPGTRPYRPDGERHSERCQKQTPRYGYH